MAVVFGTTWVRSSMTMASRDGLTAFETKGMAVCTTIDIASYTTGGETITAGQFGLKEIYGVIAQVEELGGLANNEFVSGVPIAADRLTCIIECQQDGAGGVPAESASTSNIGIISLVAFGERAGITDNV